MIRWYPDLIIDKGSYQEIKRTDKNLFYCPFCGLTFRALAYHTTQKHGISAKKLREMFNLKHNYQLITNDIKLAHRTSALKYNEGEKLKRVGKGTRFKKGFEGHLKKQWSKQAIEELSQRGKKYINLTEGR